MRAVVDVSGRPYLSYQVEIPKWQMLGDYDVFLTPEFFRALVLNAGLTVAPGPDPRRQSAPHRRGGVQGVRARAGRRHHASTPRVGGCRRPRARCDRRGGLRGEQPARAWCARSGPAGTRPRSRPTPRSCACRTRVVMPGVGHFGQAAREPRGQRAGRRGARGGGERAGRCWASASACSSSSRRARRRRTRAGWASCRARWCGSAPACRCRTSAGRGWS